MNTEKIRLPVIFGICICLVFVLSACGKTASEEVGSSQTESTVQEVEDQAGQMESEILKTQGETTIPEEESADGVSYVEAEAADTSSEQEKTEDRSGVLVVYFSHTGTTKGVSEYLHELVGGDLVEIEPVNPYPSGYSDALDPAKQEQRENARPEIANTLEHFDSYEVIYLGYPIWWGTTPMIINTLLESYDFSGKTVIPYATSGGTGIGQSIQDIRSEIPDADVKDGLLVRSNDDIIPWLQSLGMYE